MCQYRERISKMQCSCHEHARLPSNSTCRLERLQRPAEQRRGVRHPGRRLFTLPEVRISSTLYTEVSPAQACRLVFSVIPSSPEASFAIRKHLPYGSLDLRCFESYNALPNPSAYALNSFFLSFSWGETHAIPGRG